MINKRRRVKSRRKLSHEEALQRISNLMMEYQTEKEMQLTLMQPIDETMRLIFAMTGIDNLEIAKKQNEENMEFIRWKIEEDYGRYIKPGTHSLGAHPYSITKYVGKENEQLDIFDFFGG